ncbi:hypothetical protein [Bacillus alkalicellulosilyticus]|uniref:hypothetical protein n=1 Tax=Alkalihalobacterium alkalicellulosilyticum TaxID=1912214 RepID=UPI000997271F|nr:hypothetical protein [Bacillus alkalicellulosilyticus]
MSNQFSGDSELDKQLKRLNDNIVWEESRNKLVGKNIEAIIKKTERKRTIFSRSMYALSVVVPLLFIMITINFLTNNDGTSSPPVEEDENVSTIGEETKPDNKAESEKKESDDIEQLINYEILFGHSTMNGYVMYGWDHDNFNLENFKASMEYRIPDILEVIAVTENPHLKKDFEDIYDILLELELKMDNEEERKRLVHELQKIYRDLDYYVRGNTMHGSTDVTHYSRSVNNKGEVSDEEQPNKNEEEGIITTNRNVLLPNKNDLPTGMNANSHTTTNQINSVTEYSTVAKVFQGMIYIKYQNQSLNNSSFIAFANFLYNKDICLRKYNFNYGVIKI